AHDLAPPIAEVLRRQPEYISRPAMQLRHYSGAASLEAPGAAQLLISKAMKDGADATAKWLAELLERPQASGMRVMPLWLLRVDRAVRLTPKINLLPLSDLPQEE